MNNPNAMATDELADTDVLDLADWGDLAQVDDLATIPAPAKATMSAACPTDFHDPNDPRELAAATRVLGLILTAFEDRQSVLAAVVVLFRYLRHVVATELVEVRVPALAYLAKLNITPDDLPEHVQATLGSV